MKVEYNNKKIILYLYNVLLDINDIDKLHKEIKKIFIKLMSKEQIIFFGYNIVNIYFNYKYGSILEIENIYNNDYDIIDLKIILNKTNNFYLELDDYYWNINIKKMFCYNGKYYVNINNLDNILNYIEFGKIIYKLDF